MSKKHKLSLFLAAFNYGVKTKQRTLTIVTFSYLERLLALFLKEGLILGYKKQQKTFIIFFKITQNQTPFNKCKIISTSAFKYYSNNKNKISLGLYSTPLGFAFGYNLKVGGELIAIFS